MNASPEATPPVGKPTPNGYRWWVCGASVLAVLALAGILASWLAARDISRPSRPALESWHREFLDAPSAHGLDLHSLILSDGTPALLCRPDPSGRLDQRGRTLRDQLTSRGMVLPPPGAESAGTLVLVHGRRGRKENGLPIAARFCAAGFRCILIDLPGHGQHPLPEARYGLAEAELPGLALRESATRFGFDPRPAGLWGMSMGGSVAVHAAAGDPAPWQALVIVASFDALEPVIQRQASLYLGNWAGAAFHCSVSWWHRILTGQPLANVQPAQRARRLHLPVLVAHGEDDPLIPTEAARRLFDAFASTDKRWVNVGSGTHGNVLITPHPLYADMAEWFLQHLQQRLPLK